MTSVVEADGIRIPASLASLDRAARYIASLSARGELSSFDAYRLRLAVDEMVSNIILHGYKSHAGEVTLRGGACDGEVWVQIEDQAPGFDPRRAEGMPAPRNLAEGAPVGGFGLFLIFWSVDSISYEFIDGTNRSTLVVRPRNHE